MFQLPAVQVATPEAVKPLLHAKVYVAPLAVLAPPDTPLAVEKSAAHGFAAHIYRHKYACACICVGVCVCLCLNMHTHAHRPPSSRKR